MNTLVNVVRYHLVDRLQYIVLPFGIMTFIFLVNVVIFTMISVPAGEARTGAVSWLWGFVFVAGVLSIARLLPFGLALGLSRRSYYLGTILLTLGLGAVYALVLTLLQALERATGGWGIPMHFFQISWILDGSWYLTWLTSFVGFVLLFVYGMWFGLIYRRWDVTGLFAFIAAQITVVLAGALLATWTNAWTEIGGFFNTLSAAGLTGVLAAIAAALALGGFSTMRRVTV